MESDRRNGTRVEALVVVQLDDAGRYGVTRDVSTKGVLLATRVPLAIGAEPFAEKVVISEITEMTTPEGFALRVKW